MAVGRVSVTDTGRLGGECQLGTQEVHAEAGGRQAASEVVAR